MTRRLNNRAWELSEWTDVIVYILLSTDWGHGAALWAFANLLEEAAVVMEN